MTPVHSIVCAVPGAGRIPCTPGARPRRGAPPCRSCQLTQKKPIYPGSLFWSTDLPEWVTFSIYLQLFRSTSIYPGSLVDLPRSTPIYLDLPSIYLDSPWVTLSIYRSTLSIYLIHPGSIFRSTLSIYLYHLNNFWITVSYPFSYFLLRPLLLLPLSSSLLLLLPSFSVFLFLLLLFLLPSFFTFFISPPPPHSLFFLIFHARVNFSIICSKEKKRTAEARMCVTLVTLVTHVLAYSVHLNFILDNQLTATSVWKLFTIPGAHKQLCLTWPPHTLNFGFECVLLFRPGFEVEFCIQINIVVLVYWWSVTYTELKTHRILEKSH